MAERCCKFIDGRGTALGLHRHTRALYFMTGMSAKEALTCVTEFSGWLWRQWWKHCKQAPCVSQLPTGAGRSLSAKCRLLTANLCSSPQGLSEPANPSPLPLGILFSDCLCCLVVRIYV